MQSEEGLSWSSDSKDGNGSPSDYRKGDSESGDQWTRKGAKKDQEGWWDTSAEPESEYRFLIVKNLKLKKFYPESHPDIIEKNKEW